MKRRTLLRAGGAATAGGVATIAGLALGSQEAAAATTLDVAGDSVVLDGSAIAEDTATDTATLSVEAEAVDPSEYGDVSGSGGLSIELE